MVNFPRPAGLESTNIRHIGGISAAPLSAFNDVNMCAAVLERSMIDTAPISLSIQLAQHSVLTKKVREFREHSLAFESRRLVLAGSSVRFFINW